MGLKNMLRRWLEVPPAVDARAALEERADIQRRMEKRDNEVAFLHDYIRSEEFLDRVIARIRNKQLPGQVQL